MFENFLLFFSLGVLLVFFIWANPALFVNLAGFLRLVVPLAGILIYYLTRRKNK